MARTPTADLPNATDPALLAAAVPAMTLLAVAPASDDDQFLEWERQFQAAWARGSERGIGDDETERRTDHCLEIQRLIYRTPACGVVGARVKASLVLHNVQEFTDAEDCEVAALRSIIETLRRVA